ncbi:diguanylate cyclase [Shewanella waksmanii]|uniref:transporter substrate-binding domain-containing diguanylate cyclase n=1 Tax=Shewanella waksmanii TaxID=213783 RepID=UPI0037363BF0
MTVSASNETLVVANSKAWKPFSYLDSNNQPQGLLIDYWQAYGDINNINIEFKLTDWNQSLALVRNGKADVHAGLLWSNQRDQFFDYLPGLITIETQLFFANALLGTSVESFLVSGEVGVVSGGYEKEHMQQHFPNTTLIEFANNELMLSAAFAGKIAAFVADYQVANFYLYTEKQSSKFVAVKHLYSGTVRPAVKQDNHFLHHQLAQGFANITDNDRARIERKWFHIETIYPRYWLHFATLILALVIVSYTIHLRRAVAFKTQELQVKNAELTQLAWQDQLTGIANRRCFIDKLTSGEMQQAVSVGLVIFDIDDFKKINDQYGHPVGDQVIAKLANRVAAMTKAEQVFARIGGEEFALLVSNINKQNLTAFVHDVWQCVQAEKFNTDVGLLQITISIGAVWREVSADLDFNELVSLADRQMYVAKATGKNSYRIDDNL